MRVELERLTKRFGERVVLDSISAEIEFPRVLVLLGPSGGGKSTLLRIIGGLLHTDAGVLKVDGEAVPEDERALRKYRAGIGTVFQSWNLFPHLDALENVMLPLTAVHGLEREEALCRAMEILDRLQLGGHEKKHPAALSGGQRQRVAIARAVAVRPRLLLFDEPTSALDPEMTAEVLDVIADLKEEGRTFVLVTHAMNFARVVADQVGFLSKAKLLEYGPAEAFFERPKTKAAQRFLEKVLKY